MGKTTICQEGVKGEVFYVVQDNGQPIPEDFISSRICETGYARLLVDTAKLWTKDSTRILALLRGWCDTIKPGTSYESVPLNECRITSPPLPKELQNASGHDNIPPEIATLREKLFPGELESCEEFYFVRSETHYKGCTPTFRLCLEFAKIHPDLDMIVTAVNEAGQSWVPSNSGGIAPLDKFYGPLDRHLEAAGIIAKAFTRVVLKEPNALVFVDDGTRLKGEDRWTRDCLAYNDRSPLMMYEKKLKGYSRKFDGRFPSEYLKGLVFQQVLSTPGNIRRPTDISGYVGKSKALG